MPRTIAGIEIKLAISLRLSDMSVWPLAAALRRAALGGDRRFGCADGGRTVWKDCSKLERPGKMFDFGWNYRGIERNNCVGFTNSFRNDGGVERRIALSTRTGALVFMRRTLAVRRMRLGGMVLM